MSIIETPETAWDLAIMCEKEGMGATPVTEVTVWKTSDEKAKFWTQSITETAAAMRALTVALLTNQILKVEMTQVEKFSSKLH